MSNKEYGEFKFEKNEQPIVEELSQEIKTEVREEKIPEVSPVKKEVKKEEPRKEFHKEFKPTPKKRVGKVILNYKPGKKFVQYEGNNYIVETDAKLGEMVEF